MTAGAELEQLSFTVSAHIARPCAAVYEAVADPGQLSQYFTTGGASAPLDEGTTVMWEFADFPGAFPVQVKKVEKNKLISFVWDSEDGDPCTVEMKFEPIDGSTLVSISEWGWPQTERGLKQSYGNCMGWTQMQCCLKAYLEYGINLRKGAN
jgi:uncharacterized protein YndB with AHSA1/START domain